jgi:hypothetical protein
MGVSSQIRCDARKQIIIIHFPVQAPEECLAGLGAKPFPQVLNSLHRWPIRGKGVEGSLHGSHVSLTLARTAWYVCNKRSAAMTCVFIE